MNALIFPNCYALRSDLNQTHNLTLPTTEELQNYIENRRRQYEEREDIL